MAFDDAGQRDRSWLRRAAGHVRPEQPVPVVQRGSWARASALARRFPSRLDSIPVRASVRLRQPSRTPRGAGVGRALHESGARVLSWSATLDPALLCVIDEIPDLVAKSGLSLTTRGRDATIRTRSGRCRPSMTTGRFGAWRAGCVRPVGLAWSERHGVAASGAAESAALAHELVVRDVLLPDVDGPVFASARRLAADPVHSVWCWSPGRRQSAGLFHRPAGRPAQRNPRAIVYCQRFRCCCDPPPPGPGRCPATCTSHGSTRRVHQASGETTRQQRPKAAGSNPRRPSPSMERLVEPAEPPRHRWAPAALMVDRIGSGVGL